MNKSQLIEALAGHYEGNKKAAGHALESVLDVVTRELVKGEKVAITGFGAFEKVIRPSRMVRNPRTGERKRAKKTAVPKFKAGAELKAFVSGDKKLARATATKSTAANATTASKTASSRTTASRSGTTTAKKATTRSTASKSTSTAKKTPSRSTSARKTTKAPSSRSTATTSTAKSTTAKKAPASSTAKKTSTTSKRTAKKS